MRAVAAFDAIGAQWERALAQADLARVLERLGSNDRATAVRDAAGRSLERLGAVKDAAALHAPEDMLSDG